MSSPKLILLIGLAGSLAGCGPKDDDSASNAPIKPDSGVQATPEAGAENPADSLEQTPVDPPVVSPAAPALGEGTDDATATKPTIPGGDGATAPSAGGRGINLQIADSGKTVSARVGDLVIIELEANPTTGFSWEPKEAADGAVLELKSKAFLTLAQLNPEIRPAIGQGGVTTFTYRVLGAGKAAISLVYHRRWEKDVEPAKAFRVQIEATNTASPVVTGKIIFGEEPEVEKISRIEVSICNTALADGPAPLVGTVELEPPFELPITFAVPYDPANVQPNPMFYSISARVTTMVDGSEKLYYITDTRHEIFRDANDTKCDVAVKKIR